MEVKELRLGNLVLFDNENIMELASINSDDTIRLWREKETDTTCGCFRLNRIKPIPLTEEWLLKFGFTIRDKNYSLNYGGESMRYAFLDNPKNIFILYFHGRHGFNVYESRRSEDYCIQYVHQLQNLYFALTNKELTLKSD